MERNSIMRGAAKPSFASEGCVSLRFSHVECHACADICPVDAIEVAGGVLAVSSDCHGCARCVPVCPTGAITIDDPTTVGPASPLAPSRPLRVECHRAPPEDAGQPRVTARCLGALGVNGLLRLRLDAGDAPIQVVDRGWCAKCPAGGPGAHPAAAAVSDVQLLFEQLDLPRELAPALIRAPIDVAPLQFAIADDPSRGYTRRHILRRIVSRSNRAERRPAVSPIVKRAGRARERLSARERDIRRSLIEHIAERWRSAVHDVGLPTANLGTGCADHRICVAVCPTGALHIANDGSLEALAFDAVRCIECGACATHCPEKAINVTPGATAPGGEPLQWLKALVTRECTECGDSYPDLGHGVEVCPSCRRSSGLFATLAVPRRAPGRPVPHDDRRPAISIERG